MLYVGYVLEKLLDVNSIIDNVVTSDLIRMCVFGSALYHCIIEGKDLFHCIACTCNCRQCCDVRPNNACAYSGLRYTIAIIGGKDLFHCVACTGRAE